MSSKQRTLLLMALLLTAPSQAFLSPADLHLETSRDVFSSDEKAAVLFMGGFLDGKYDKSNIMKQEDDAMWIDDGESSSEGWNPFKIISSFDKPKPKQSAPAPPPPPAKKASPAPFFASMNNKPKPEAKKAPEPETPKKQTGFKFPWDN